MKIRWLWVLLCVSVVFNVLFAIGYVRAQANAGQKWSFEQRARWIADHLDLDTDQQRAFDSLLEETLAKRAQLRQGMKPWREKFFAELVKDQPDEAVLGEFLEQDHFKVRRQLMIEQIRKLMTILKPSQRQQFVEVMRKRWDRKSHRNGR